MIVNHLRTYPSEQDSVLEVDRDESVDSASFTVSRTDPSKQYVDRHRRTTGQTCLRGGALGRSDGGSHVCLSFFGRGQRITKGNGACVHRGEVATADDRKLHMMMNALFLNR